MFKRYITCDPVPVCHKLYQKFLSFLYLLPLGSGLVKGGLHANPKLQLLRQMSKICTRKP